MLGVQAIRHRCGLAAGFESVAVPRGIWRAAREGFVVGVASPKAVILFAAILPQFIDRPAGHIPVQMLLLCLVSFLIALISDSPWALLAQPAPGWGVGNGAVTSRNPFSGGDQRPGLRRN